MIKSLIRAGWFIALLIAGCDSLSVEPPTLTPTRAFSAPTLQPSPVVSGALPTDVADTFGNPGQNSIIAAGLPANSALPPLPQEPVNATGGFYTVQLTLEDNTQLTGDMFVSSPVQSERGGVSLTPRLPGLVLVGTDRLTWGDIPLQLRDIGYTVLLLHPPSDGRTPNIAAVLRKLSSDDAVNPGAMAVIAVERGAAAALEGCAVEPLCDAAAIISPIDQAALGNTVAAYGTRPLLIAISSGDQAGMTAVQVIQSNAQGEITLRSYDGAARGMTLFETQPDLFTGLAAWLQTHVAIDTVE